MHAIAKASRVHENTAEEINRDIRIRTVCRIEYYAEHPDEIDGRLAELDREWDVERVLETNASALALSGLAMGIMGNKKCFLLTAGVLGFLFQHAVEGWCPPLPILRRMGVRTRAEIDQEYYALRMLRGDFAKASGTKNTPPKVEDVLEGIGLT